MLSWIPETLFLGEARDTRFNTVKIWVKPETRDCKLIPETRDLRLLNLDVA